MALLEICCPTVESLLAAYLGGADRVELCCALSLDGLTPSAGMIQYAVGLRREAESMGRRFDVNVLIRPREGNFVYSTPEIETMAMDIADARRLGANGVVMGALTPEGDINIDAMRVLMNAAKGMCVTFHRAFDHGRNPAKMLEDVIALGCNCLLTSGCAPTAIEGKDAIKQLHIQADGRIIIMAGAGVMPENAQEILEYTGVSELHGSARGSQEIIAQLKSIVS